jgi:hypothetical protein
MDVGIKSFVLLRENVGGVTDKCSNEQKGFHGAEQTAVG